MQNHILNSQMISLSFFSWFGFKMYFYSALSFVIEFSFTINQHTSVFVCALALHSDLDSSVNLTQGGAVKSHPVLIEDIVGCD